MKLLALLLLLTAPVAAQTECKTSFKDFPALHGVRLGGPGKLGTIKPKDRPDIDYILVRDFRGLVDNFTIYYDRSLKWNNAAELAEKFTEYLPLPKTGWQEFGRDSVSIACKDFSVSISTASNTVTFTVRDLDSLTDQRTDWKRKAAFKP